MNKMMPFLERYLMPIAHKIQSNRYLIAVRDGFMGMMPLLIIGSFFLLIANLPIPGYTEFLVSVLGDNVGILTYVFDATYGLMALLVIIGIALSLAREYKLHSTSLVVVAVVSFFLLIPFSVNVPIAGSSEVVKFAGAISMTYLGSSGIFVALFVSIISIEIFRFVTNKGWTLKMPASVPPAVASSFSSLFPALIVLVFWLIIRVGIQFTTFETVQNLVFSIVQAPLMWMGNSLLSQILSEFFTLLFWFFGIHGSSVVGSIMGPVWQTLSAENLANFQQGIPPVNIITQQFRDVFIIAGGTGVTLGLIIAVFTSAKSKTFRELCKLAAPAAVFNINEPIIFGVPIVLNPIMFIPFLVAPVLLTITTYVAMATGLVPLTNGVALPWTTPVIISGFLACGWQGVVLQVINLGLAFVIYLPFVKLQDKEFLKMEQGVEADA